MDKRTASIIGLVIAIMFCGLPGLCGLCFGPFFALISMIPGADINVFGSNNPDAGIGFGIGTFCVSVLFILIPVLVWYFTLRKKSASEDVIEYTESLPEDDF